MAEFFQWLGARSKEVKVLKLIKVSQRLSLMGGGIDETKARTFSSATLVTESGPQRVLDFRACD